MALAAARRENTSIRARVGVARSGCRAGRARVVQVLRRFAALAFALALGSLAQAEGATTVCPLPWNANASMPNGVDLKAKCPYGHRLKYFDVTIPSGMQPLSIEGVCVAWGVIPFVIIGLGVLDAARVAIISGGIGTRELFFLSFVLAMVVLNELIFKRLASEPRPDRSCNFTCGFPSGHATMSCGFFMLMFLDAVFRTMPRLPFNIEEARDEAAAIEGRSTFFGWTPREICIQDLRTLFTLMPLSTAHTLNQRDFAVYSILWGILLLPVPFSRVILNDHTPSQVSVGATIGMLEALVFFGVARFLQQRLNHRLGQRIGGVLLHNFPMPVYEVQSKCYRLLAQMEDDSSKTPRALQRELVWIHRELEWYMEDLRPSCTYLAFDEDRVIADREMQKLQRLREEICEKMVIDPETVDTDNRCFHSDESSDESSCEK